MFFPKTLLVLSGFTLAQAFVALTNTDYSGITVGVPFNITWGGQTGLVTLKLKNGPAEAQLLVGTIAEGLAGNSYQWIPEATLAEGIYNLEIDDTNGDVNYSPQFEIVGSTALPITSVPFPAPTASTTVASSTSTEATSVTLVVPTYSAEAPSNTLGPSTVASSTSTEATSVTLVVPTYSAEAPSNTLGPSTVAPVLVTAPTSYSNMTMTGMYTNSTMTSISYVAPGTNAIPTPPPTASSVVTAGAIRQVVQPLATMLLAVAGLAFLF